MAADDVQEVGAAPGWGVLPYGATVLFLTGLQLRGLLTMAEVLGGANELGVAERFVAAAVSEQLLILSVLVLQVLKILPTVRRLRDLGRAPDDAMYTVVPALNVVLFVQCLARSPSDALRKKRVRSWVTQVGALQSMRRALGLMAATWRTGVAVVVVASLVVGVGGIGFLALILSLVNGGSADALQQAAWVVAAGSALYTVVQLPKRDQASRASWLPSLLLVPALALGGGMLASGGATQGLGPVVIILTELAWFVSVGAVVGGVATRWWVVAARRVQGGAPVAGTWLDAVWAWGLRAQMVQLGSQVIIPGIWFAVSYAFADLVAILHPEQASFARSSALVRGIRGKVFQLLVLWQLGVLVLTLAVWLPFLSPTGIVAVMFDPSSAPWHISMLEQLVWWGMSWWTVLATWIIYEERHALWVAKYGDEGAA